MLRIAATFIALATIGATALGFEIGETVVVVGETELKVETRGTTRVRPGIGLRIAGIQGNWLWASFNGHSGWIESRYVVSMDHAIPTLTEMIRQNPRDAWLYSGRAQVFVARKEYDRAIADHNEAIRLSPIAMYYTIRGLTWFHKGENDKAIADYNEALRLDPKNGAAYNNRGVAWKESGEYKKALADFSEALRLDPTNSQAYNDRGLVWSEMGEYDKAIADHNKALRLDPNYARSYFYRGVAWRKKAQYDKAVADYSAGLRLDPKDAWAYVSRGIAWRTKGEYDKALADFNEAQRLDPGGASPYNMLAWLWATCPDEHYRNGPKSVEYATKACELTGWKDAVLLDTLAAAYAEAGNCSEAVKCEQKALDLATKANAAEFRSHLELYTAGKPCREQKR
jgi:tetratricopeptide (TPR) repeat protein